MNNLTELIGREVTAIVGYDKDDYCIVIPCKIIDVKIEDYYFEEKNEQINILVNVDPVGDLPEDIDYEALYEIPLDNIRWKNK